MTTVLFTGGGGAGSSALVRLLGDRYNVHFADSDPCARPHGVSPDRWHVIPRADSPWFLTHLAVLCRALDSALLVPGVDEELHQIAQNRDLLPHVLLPRDTFIASHLDKLASADLLAGVVDAPKTVGCGQFFRPPCIVKPRRGRGSRGVHVVRNSMELQAALTLAREECVQQEYLEGQEYTVTVAADADGNLRAIVPVLVSLKRGVTIRARTHHDVTVVETCERIHDAYGTHGCYNVQGVKTADGAFRPFEINPRVSTTLCLAIAAGVDPIGIYLGQYPGEGLLPFTDGLDLRRSWHNEFVAA